MAGPVQSEREVLIRGLIWSSRPGRILLLSLLLGSPGCQTLPAHDESPLDPDQLAVLLDHVGGAPAAQLRIDPRLFESHLEFGTAPLLELIPLEDQRGLEERVQLLSERAIPIGDVLRDERCAIGNLAIRSAEYVAERVKWKCGVDGDHVTVAFGQPRASDSPGGVIEIPSVEMTVREIAGSTFMMVYRLERSPTGWRFLGKDLVSVLE